MDEPARDDEEFTELRDAVIGRMDGVGKAANGTRFLIAKSAGDAPRGLFAPDFVRDLIAKSEPEKPQETVTMTGSPAAIAALIHNAPVRKAEASTASMNDRPDSDFAYIEAGGTKDESGKTTPRSLRHFPIYDAAHVRNALSRAPQSPFGDKAMPKIRAAAKRFGIEVAKADGETAGLDPMTVLAEPEGDAPGNPAEPGSPAWEAIDAATARKWTAILARACNALCVMAEREMLEAAAGDSDDAGAAFDLEDAKCAIDYAISVLAPFAVGEQAETDLGSEALASVGKALAAFDAEQLDVVEALAPVVKAGRVLSAGNEAAIRAAAEALQKVLASLPAPVDDSGQPVAKQTQETAMTAPATEPTTEIDAPTAEVVKAEPEAQIAVYTREGVLCGFVAPGTIVPVAQPEAPEGSEPDGDESDGEMVEVADAAPVVGPDEDAEVIPGTSTVASPAADEEDVMKAAVAGFGPLLAEALAPIAEELKRNAGLADVVKGLQERVEHLAAMPDDRKSPLLNGATGALPADGGNDALAELRKAVADADTPVARREAEQKLAYAEIRSRFA